MLPRPHPDIAFYAFAEGGVLHRTGSHRLWVLNATAATLWCLLDGTRDADALARDYAARFDIEAPTARQDVTTLLERFARWDLLDGAGPRKTKKHREAHPLTAPGGSPPLVADLPGLPRTVVALAGRCFSVILTDRTLAAAWQDLTRHLASENCRAEADFVILRQEDGTAFSAYESGLAVEDGLTAEGVIPFLVYALFEKGMAALPHRLLFHAAVVARDGRALILPACSGAGKSTLAAALCASGWTYLSDELAVVDPRSLQVEPFALPVGLKDKSVAPLARFIPGIQDLPRQIRADGVGVRYLPPPRAAPEDGLPVAKLVFPRFGPHGKTTASPLSPIEALENLARTGSSARPLDVEDIQTMLALAQIPARALAFDDLQAAVDALDAIIRE